MEILYFKKENTNRNAHLPFKALQFLILFFLHFHCFCIIFAHLVNLNNEKHFFNKK